MSAADTDALVRQMRDALKYAMCMEIKGRILGEACTDAIAAADQWLAQERGPLTDEEIDRIAPAAQLYFARNFGAAPGDWTNEQVRTYRTFRGAVTEIVRDVERAHGVGQPAGDDAK